MYGYLFRRLLGTIPVMLVVAVFIFLMLRLTPSDPAAILAGDSANSEQIAQIRQQLGLDQPMLQQFVIWSGRVLTGDFGESFFFKKTVAALIGERIEPTLSLAFFTMLIAVCVAVPLGVMAAHWHGSWLDRLVMGFSVLGFSVPVFVVGYLLIYVFSARLGLLPASGFGDGRLAYLVLPALTLSQASTAYVARITRSSVLDEVGENYVKAARAKGLSEPRLLVRHALRNALLPIITVVGIDFGSYLSGAVLTESIFAWPGLGRFTLDAILKRDLPAIQGSVLFMAAAFMTVNLAVDLLYARVDPRVKLGSGGAS